MTRWNTSKWVIVGAIQIWNTQTRKCIVKLKGHSKQVKRLVQLTERIFASGSVDETIRLFDVKTY